MYRLVGSYEEGGRIIEDRSGLCCCFEELSNAQECAIKVRNQRSSKDEFGPTYTVSVYKDGETDPVWDSGAIEGLAW
jgi:hypothetical protein